MPGEGWDGAIEDLGSRRDASRAMGPAERRQVHADAGKLDARARIDHLLDAGSFLELGTLAGGEDAPADAVVMGSGRIDGRPVMIAAEDVTVKAGTIGAASNAKRYRAAELAAGDRVPLVMLLEGAGFRADGQAHPRAPTDLIAQARCRGRVPVVTAVLGASAGHGALIAPLSDYVVMARHASIFAAGPPVVLEAMGEEVTKEDLGGPAVAVDSGLVHDVADDDRATLDRLRCYLGYFPSSAWSYPPPATAGYDTGPRSVPELFDLVPAAGRQVYDVRGVVDAVCDTGSCFEVQPSFGAAIVCTLARLGGHPVAVVANQPMSRGGAIDSDAADKAAHFLAVADSFHLPLVFLADNPGVLPGSASERRAVLRSGARLYAAHAHATSPKVTVILRKAYGFGAVVMGILGFDGQSAVFSFPGATMGAMGAAAMSRARQSDAAEAAALRDLEVEASFRSAERFGVDELIDPADTRNVLLQSLERALHRRQAAPEPVARIGITP